MWSHLAAQGDSCAGISCAYCMISENGTRQGKDITLVPGPYDLLRMLQGICPPGNGSTLLIKRACFDEVGDFLTMEVGQDAEMWLRIVGESSRKYLHYLPSCLVRYRQRDSSLLKRSRHARQASFEYRLEKYLPMVAPKARWKVYSGFARHSGFVGPGWDAWRKTMSRKALLSGGLRAVRTTEGRELIGMALWGVRR